VAIAAIVLAATYSLQLSQVLNVDLSTKLRQLAISMATLH
jgi:hypothetical protein